MDNEDRLFDLMQGGIDEELSFKLLDLYMSKVTSKLTNANKMRQQAFHWMLMNSAGLGNYFSFPFSLISLIIFKF